MIKGCQKKVIIVQGGENSPFETAFFVLRKDSENCCSGGDDILREADRIIAESIPDVRRRRERREKLLRRLLPAAGLAVGALLGAGGYALIVLL